MRQLLLAAVAKHFVASPFCDLLPLFLCPLCAKVKVYCEISFRISVVFLFFLRGIFSVGIFLFFTATFCTFSWPSMRLLERVKRAVNFRGCSRRSYCDAILQLLLLFLQYILTALRGSARECICVCECVFGCACVSAGEFVVGKIYAQIAFAQNQQKQFAPHRHSGAICRADYHCFILPLHSPFLCTACAICATVQQLLLVSHFCQRVSCAS